MQASPVGTWAFPSGSVAINPGLPKPTCNAKRKTTAFSVLCAYKPPQWNPQVNLLAFSLLDPTNLLASSCQSWPASAFNICLTLLTRISADPCPGHLVTIRSAGYLSVHIFKAISMTWTQTILFTLHLSYCYGLWMLYYSMAGSLRVLSVSTSREPYDLLLHGLTRCTCQFYLQKQHKYKLQTYFTCPLPPSALTYANVFPTNISWHLG